MNKKSLLPLVIISLCLLLSVGVAFAAEVDIVRIDNIAGVSNHPSNPSIFTTDRAYNISYFMTYHWNSAKGMPPGTIGLQSQNGTKYGPWQASSQPGQGGVPNAYWIVHPNIILPAGTYTVLDSNPVSWSHNSQTNYRGMTIIKGTPVQQTEVQIAYIGNIGGVNNQPSNPSTFTINHPYLVTYFMTYHWNNAKGKTPGSIGLRNHNGTMYGPWQTFGQPGQGGVPNAYWIATPNIVIPAGTYTVVDSDPSTWAHNAQSGYSGMITIKGIQH